MIVGDDMDGPSENAEADDLTAFDAQDKETFREMSEKFHEQYGAQADPTMVLGILLCHSGGINREDYWRCLSLSYPSIFPLVVNFNRLLGEVDNVFNPKSDFNVILEEWSIHKWDIDFLLLGHSHQNQNAGKWEADKDKLVSLTGEIEVEWRQLRVGLERLPRSIQGVDSVNRGIIATFQGLIDHLRGEIKSVEDTLNAAKNDEEEEAAKKSKGLELSEEPDIQMGVPKTGSWTSGRQGASDDSTMKNRNGFGPNDGNPKEKFFSGKKGGLLPFHRERENEMPKESYPMGGHRSVLCTVIFCEIIGLVTMGLAAWQCPPPENKPVIDSNFWSTLSSAVIALASLYCTAIPLLRKEKIQVDNEPLFYSLLSFSTLTAMAAAACYPYETRASLVLISLSGCAALATTLQIIEGAVQQSFRQKGEIHNLEVVNRELRARP